MSVRLHTIMSPQPVLRHRSELHLARKIWHFSCVLIVAVIYHNVTRPVALQLLILWGSAFIVVDLLRQQSERLNRFVLRVMGSLMRENEEKALAGSTYMALGIFLIVLFFPPHVVKLSLLFLATADPIASYVGIRYGKDKLIGPKSLQGSLAAFVICTLGAAVFYVMNDIMVERLLIVSVLSGLAGAFSEVVPVGKLDDNLVMPVISSALLWTLFFIFGGF